MKIIIIRTYAPIKKNLKKFKKIVYILKIKHIIKYNKRKTEKKLKEKNLKKVVST